MCYLKNVKMLTLNSCYGITDDDLQYLENVETLIIFNCKNIRGDGFIHLKKLKNIFIHGLILPCCLL